MTIDEVHEMLKNRPKWLKAYQYYVDTVMNSYDGSVYGMGTCDTCDYCDYCDFDEMGDSGCAKALERYVIEKGGWIDYRKTSHKYFRKLLLGETE